MTRLISLLCLNKHFHRRPVSFLASHPWWVLLWLLTGPHTIKLAHFFCSFGLFKGFRRQTIQQSKKNRYKKLISVQRRVGVRRRCLYCLPATNILLLLRSSSRWTTSSEYRVMFLSVFSGKQNCTFSERFEKWSNVIVIF